MNSFEDSLNGGPTPLGRAALSIMAGFDSGVVNNLKNRESLTQETLQHLRLVYAIGAMNCALVTKQRELASLFANGLLKYSEELAKQQGGISDSPIR